MKRLSALILVFTIVFTIFLIGPPFLGQPFAWYPLMNVSEVFDVFTPLVLIPIYWLLYRSVQPNPTRSGIITFLIFAALWTQGQGMHLAANSIHHLLEGMEATDIYKLTYFYDEVLSHYIWHVGIMGLSAFIIYQQWKHPFTSERAPLWPLYLAGIIHGFTLFLIVIEGGTAPLGVTFAVLAGLFGFIWVRKRMRQQPITTFFFVSYIVATLFFIGWGIYWRGLPQFSEVGFL